VNIDSTSPLVQAASNAAQGSVAEAASVAVLKKSQDAEASAALQLIQAIPQAPSLATEGKIGTQLNVFA
jgi:hypothetical protein